MCVGDLVRTAAVTMAGGTKETVTIRTIVCYGCHGTVCSVYIHVDEKVSLVCRIAYYYFLSLWGFIKPK